MIFSSAIMPRWRLISMYRGETILSFEIPPENLRCDLEIPVNVPLTMYRTIFFRNNEREIYRKIEGAVFLFSVHYLRYSSRFYFHHLVKTNKGKKIPHVSNWIRSSTTRQELGQLSALELKINLPTAFRENIIFDNRGHPILTIFLNDHGVWCHNSEKLFIEFFSRLVCAHIENTIKGNEASFD